MAAEHMLSTIDNPYSPVTDYDSWYAWDRRAGYYTPEFLARCLRSSYDLSDADQDVAIEEAIDEICRENVLGIYIKVPVTYEAAA